MVEKPEKINGADRERIGSEPLVAEAKRLDETRDAPSEAPKDAKAFNKQPEQREVIDEGLDKAREKLEKGTGSDNRRTKKLATTFMVAATLFAYSLASVPDVDSRERGGRSRKASTGSGNVVDKIGGIVDAADSLLNIFEKAKEVFSKAKDQLPNDKTDSPPPAEEGQKINL